MSGGVVSLTARSAYAQTVSSIIVQGNQRVEADTIRSYFRPGPNGQLDAFQIDEGVKALISTGLFQDVRPTIQGGRLTITVVENPVINRIAFEGNKKVKDDQLKSEIQSKERGTRRPCQLAAARLITEHAVSAPRCRRDQHCGAAPAKAPGRRAREPLAREREPIKRVRARLEALIRANAAPRCGARSKRTGKRRPFRASEIDVSFSAAALDTGCAEFSHSRRMGSADAVGGRLLIGALLPVSTSIRKSHDRAGRAV